MYRVEILHESEDRGAHYAAENLGEAVLHAVIGSQTYTPEAFIIGLLAAAVTEGVFEVQDRDLLKGFLRKIRVPNNVKDVVADALSE